MQKVFVFGCCVGPSGKYESGLLVSIRRFQPDAPVIERRHQPSIHVAYNSIMDEAAALPGLEGLVLVHDDVVLRDAQTLATLRSVLSDPGVGLVGTVGGYGQRELSWWKSLGLAGHVDHATHSDRFSCGVAEVDVVDGLFMALSPWAVRNIRLDGRGYPAFHGYDGELCSLVRQRGRKVVVADFDLFHNCKQGPWGSPEYGQALLEWQMRWHKPKFPESVMLRARHGALRVLASYPALQRLPVLRPSP